MDGSVTAALAVRKAPTFDAACALVVDFLHEAVPLGYWAVTRFDGERQLYLEVRDDAYGLQAGDSHAWEDSMCVRMVAGDGPRVAADAMGVPAYETAGVARDLSIGTYVGIPIEQGDGELFGTLCGLDPEVGSEDLAGQQSLLELLAALLSMVLDADLEATEAARALERAERAADTDALTGLLNRRGWDQLLDVEEARLRRFGDPGAVIVVDLDRFKQVNDQHGHAAGDRHLVATADALRGCVRPHDFSARVGGDEFAVLATRVTPADVAALVARIEATLDEYGVAASVGHASYGLTTGLQAACTAADEAMYRGKRLRADERDGTADEGH